MKIKFELSEQAISGPESDDNLPAFNSLENAYKAQYITDINIHSAIQSIAHLLGINEYFNDEIIEYMTILIQFIILISVLAYSSRDDISQFIQSINQQHHHYPTPRRVDQNLQREHSQINTSRTTFEDGLLIIALQLATLCYVSSALYFTPVYETDAL